MSDLQSRSLDAIFRPASVGVLGVSSSEGRLGNIVCANVLKRGYTGPVYGIGSGNVPGAHCVPSLEQLPEAPDLLFLAAPAKACLSLASQASDAGVRAIIVGAAGFAESGDEGCEMQQGLADLARRTGLMIVGPNCNGIYNSHAQLSVGFNSGHGRSWPPGGIALLSHSGALFDALARAIVRFGGGLSLFVSAGNEADLDVLDYLQYSLDDERTKVIALLIDSVPDAARLKALAQRATAAGKPIMALKLGSSAKGADAATAHSSRLAGKHAAHEALFSACGIHSVHTLEALASTAAMLERFGPIKGKLASISTSGAGASLVADLCHKYAVPLADYGSATREALSARGKFSTLANPTDMGFFGTLDVLGHVMEAITADEEVGAFLAFIHSVGPSHVRFAEAWRASIALSGKPHVILAPGGLEADELAAFRDAGALVVHESEPCFVALAAILAEPVQSFTPEVTHGNRLPESLRPGPLDENASLAILAASGARTVAAQRCETVDQAVAAAARLGFPVVLKGIAEGVAHKSDQGLVQLNLPDEAAVRHAHARVGTSSVLVQSWLPGELEAIIGYSNDPGAGPMLVFGLGGIHAETLAQTRTVSLPVSRSVLASTLDDSVIGRVLVGPRWGHPAAREDFLDMMGAVQALALANADGIEAIDLNPVTLGSHGAVAVDALIVIAGDQRL